MVSPPCPPRLLFSDPKETTTLRNQPLECLKPLEETHGLIDLSQKNNKASSNPTIATKIWSIADTIADNGRKPEASSNSSVSVSPSNSVTERLSASIATPPVLTQSKK